MAQGAGLSTETPTASGNAALVATDVSVRFGGLSALDGASVVVPEGRLTALIGPNGAGKTTLFNVMSGLLRPDAGRVALFGRDVAGWTADRITGAGMVRSFQIARGLPKMTVFEHLMLYGQNQPGERPLAALLRPPAARRREDELAQRALAVARRLRLTPMVDNPVTALSGGQKKLLEIGRALMAEPKVILFDEPAAGVNPTLAEEIGDELRRIVADGRTVLLIEHDMALVERIADHVIVMALGRRLAEGTFDVVRANEDVQAAYLGGRR